MKQFLKTTEKITVDSYPYGRLRCTAYFSVEHNSGKGFRSVFQTINPKTGRLNAEKKSTYSPVLVMYKDSETGHVNYFDLRFYSREDMNKDAQFMSEHFDLFTPEQIKDIYGYVALKLKAEAGSVVQYCGSDKAKTWDLFKPSIEQAINGYKTGENLFSKIVLDLEAIEALKVPGYNPFKVTTYVLKSAQGE